MPEPACSEMRFDRAAQVIRREVRLLDDHCWDDWLALYDPDAVFWVPTWTSEGSLCSDPQRELSLIYYAGRRRLEERVWRLRSGQSAASVPLPRTLHMVTGMEQLSDSETTVTLRSGFTTHIYYPRTKTQHVFFGTYEHEIGDIAGQPLIARKRIVLLNDHIPSSLDFFHL